MLRVYTKVEKEIRKGRGANKLKFNISIDKVTEYDEWVVVGINFHDCDKSKDKALVFTIYIYKYMNGFKIVNATSAIRQNQIFLDFDISDISEKIPDYEDNAAEMFLTNITASLKNGFHGQAYNKDQRNFLNLIQKINWKPEIPIILKQSQQLKSSLLGTVIGGALAVAVVVFVVYTYRKRSPNIRQMIKTNQQ